MREEPSLDQLAMLCSVAGIREKTLFLSERMAPLFLLLRE